MAIEREWPSSSSKRGSGSGCRSFYILMEVDDIGGGLRIVLQLLIAVPAFCFLCRPPIGCLTATTAKWNGGQQACDPPSAGPSTPASRSGRGPPTRNNQDGGRHQCPRPNTTALTDRHDKSRFRRREPPGGSDRRRSAAAAAPVRTFTRGSPLFSGCERRGSALFRRRAKRAPPTMADEREVLLLLAAECRGGCCRLHRSRGTCRRARGRINGLRRTAGGSGGCRPIMSAPNKPKQPTWPRWTTAVATGWPGNTSSWVVSGAEGAPGVRAGAATFLHACDGSYGCIHSFP